MFFLPKKSLELLHTHLWDALHSVAWHWQASSLTARCYFLFLPEKFPVFHPAQHTGGDGCFPAYVRYADLCAPQDNVSLVPLPKGMAGRCSGPKEIKELPGRAGQAFPFHLNILFVILSHSQRWRRLLIIAGRALGDDSKRKKKIKDCLQAPGNSRLHIWSKLCLLIFLKQISSKESEIQAA